MTAISTSSGKKHYGKADADSIYQVRAKAFKAVNLGQLVWYLEAFRDNLRPKSDQVIYPFPLVDGSMNYVDISPVLVFGNPNVKFLSSDEAVYNFLNENYALLKMTQTEIINQLNLVPGSDILIALDPRLRAAKKDCVKKEGYVVTNLPVVGRALVRHENFALKALIHKNGPAPAPVFRAFAGKLGGQRDFDLLVKTLKEGAFHVFQRTE